MIVLRRALSPTSWSSLGTARDSAATDDCRNWPVAQAGAWRAVGTVSSEATGRAAAMIGPPHSRVPLCANSFATRFVGGEDGEWAPAARRGQGPMRLVGGRQVSRRAAARGLRGAVVTRFAHLGLRQARGFVGWLPRSNAPAGRALWSTR